MLIVAWSAGVLALGVADLVVCCTLLLWVFVCFDLGGRLLVVVGDLWVYFVSLLLVGIGCFRRVCCCVWWSGFVSGGLRTRR